MGKKSRRNKPGKSSGGLSRREAIQARRNINSVIPAPTSPSETLRTEKDTLRRFLKRFPKDNKWDSTRIVGFWKYDKLIFDSSEKNPWTSFTDDDKSFLKDTYTDEEELSLLRALALHSWAAICWANMKYEDVSYCHQVAIKICNEATDYEKRRLDSIAKDWFDKIKGKSLCILTEMSKKDSRGDFVTCHGGQHCDSCDKLVKEYGVDFMACCGKCQLSYYCSKECQKLDWEFGGHKQACRKKGEFRAGDTVFVADPDAPNDRPAFSQLEAPVMCAGSTLNKPRKWLVSAQTKTGDLEFFFVDSKNLRRVRSALWLPYLGKQELMAELLQKTKVDGETESEGISDDEGESLLAKDFLEFSNYRLLPWESCHRSDVVADFRLFYDKYKSPDTLPDKGIEELLADWNKEYAKAYMKDGVYYGFQLNPYPLIRRLPTESEISGEGREG